MINNKTSFNLLLNLKTESKRLFNLVNKLYFLLFENNIKDAEKKALEINNSKKSFSFIFNNIKEILEKINIMQSLDFTTLFFTLDFSSSYSPQEVIFDIITSKLFNDETFLKSLLNSNSLLNIYLENRITSDFLKSLIGKSLIERKTCLIKKIDDDLEIWDIENIKVSILKFKEGFNFFNKFIDNFILRLNEEKEEINSQNENIEDATNKLKKGFDEWK